MFDVTKFVADLHDYIGKALSPIMDRIKALEAKAPIPGERGEKGEQGSQGDRGADGAQGERGERGEKGETGEKGEPGQDAEIDYAKLAAAVCVELLAGPGLKGLTDLQVAESVQEYFKSNPVRDGKDGAKGERGERGEKGDAGAEGVGLAGFVIDRDGNFIATTSKGQAHNLGLIVGKDGKDGRDGADGKDGIGLDSFELAYLPETHEIEVKASAAGRVKELRYPAGGIRHGGFWNEGKKYLAGQATTHDGHCWIALRDTSAKPAYENEKDWALLVRKGRDGRDGKDGKPPPGPVKLGTDSTGPQ